MKQTMRKNHGTIIVPVTKADVAFSGKAIAKLPIGARIHSVNVSVDEVFNGTTNTITVGVAGTTNKFQAGFSLASLAGNTSTRQHTASVGTEEILVTIAAAGATTGAAVIAIDFSLPTEVSVEY